jgi:hypothetical protein
MMPALQLKLQREEAILSSLKKLDYLTRSQIQRLHNLGGERNARRILNSINPYVSIFRGQNGEHIYYLNRAGRERVGCDVVRQKTIQAGHYLMRNDAFIHYAGHEDWKNEMKFSVPDVVTVIPDAYFRYQQRRHFLEVDHLQHMTKNRDKIERYRNLNDTGTLQKRIGYFPCLVWVTLTENRRQQLAELCRGMDVAIHLWDEIK